MSPVETQWSWFYSAPLEDVAVRRGDPLGMRGLAEQFAEELAPGLSNRTTDARWFTILSWCLEQGYAVWRLYGEGRGDGLSTRAAMRSLYAWIRPLEALWLARTVIASEQAGKGRQLPGVRAVRRWLDERQSSERFGFSSSSYDRYRFTGIYGAYRIGFRMLPGLTLNGDGWRIGEAGRELAEITAQYATAARSHRRGKGRRPAPESYWLRSFAWETEDTTFLPTMLEAPTKLPASEQRVLRHLLFAPKSGSDMMKRNAERRKAVVILAGKADTDDRVELFRCIADGLATSVPSLQPLPAFCALAQAGVAAMNAVWTVVRDASNSGYPKVDDVVNDSSVVAELDHLAAASARWLADSRRFGKGFHVPSALSSSFVAARGDRDKQLRALENHHRQYGGGRSWIGISDNRVLPEAPLRGGGTADYRFRVGALSRLAVQCGVIDDMPHPYAYFDDEDDDSDEEEMVER